MSENEQYVGKWEVISIGLYPGPIDNIETVNCTLDDSMIGKLITSRKKFSHKGTYGNALIIAGRYGMMGAAVLSAKACLRGGAGLTTVCIPEKGYNIIQTSVPEALIESGKSDEVFNGIPDLSPFQSIACGSAIGFSVSTVNALHQLLVSARAPLVLDADALTIISEREGWLGLIPQGSVITPHPKEFDRLAGKSPDMYTRHQKQLEIANRYKLVVILKGAHTIICSPDGRSFFNTTGNPGTASGGTGDVLTGLIVSLLAQGYNQLNAALIAVYLHGLAADIALQSSSVEALIAGDIIENLGKAFRMVKYEEKDL